MSRNEALALLEAQTFLGLTQSSWIYAVLFDHEGVVRMSGSVGNRLPLCLLSLLVAFIRPATRCE